MALSRLTMTRSRLMRIAPFDRQTATTMGSISGVRPTATAIAKKNASRQLPLVKPLMRNTSGTMTTTNRRISHVKRSMPLSKAVGGSSSVRELAVPPRYVSWPVATTTAVPEPLSTLVPRNATLVNSTGALAAGFFSASNFSTGKLSPVSVLWFTNRSFAASTRTSAGIMSPAANATMSPGTSCEIGISLA